MNNQTTEILIRYGSTAFVVVDTSEYTEEQVQEIAEVVIGKIKMLRGWE